MTTTTGPAVLRAGQGHVTGEPGLLDRYLLDSAQSGGRVALIEHELAPRVLAAPLHKHSREDEYSFVLAGTLGVIEDGVEVFAGTGDLVVKSRDRWHTFWNAGEDTLRVLEIITPGGLEGLFRLVGAQAANYDAVTLPALAREYGCEVDFEQTTAIVRKHGLQF